MGLVDDDTRVRVCTCTVRTGGKLYICDKKLNRGYLAIIALFILSESNFDDGKRYSTY